MRITDTSGIYNIDTNPDGYGAPNPAIADVVSITAILTPPGSTETITLDFTDEIPATVTGNIEFDDQEIDYVDGLWTIEYIVETASDTYSSTKEVYFTCNIRCCLDRAWADLSEECDCCDAKAKRLELLDMEGLYKSLLSASACNKSSRKDALLKKIQRYCSTNKCNCN